MQRKSNIAVMVLLLGASLQLGCTAAKSSETEARKRNTGAGKEVEQPDGIAGYIIGPERFGYDANDSRIASEVRQPNMRDFEGAFRWPIANFHAEQSYVVVAFDPGKVDPEEFVAQISDTSRDCNHRFTYDSFYVDADAGVVVIQPTSGRAKFAAFLVVTALPEDACYQSYHDSVSIALTAEPESGVQRCVNILVASNSSGAWQLEPAFADEYLNNGIAMTRLHGSSRLAIAFLDKFYEQRGEAAAYEWVLNTSYAASRLSSGQSAEVLEMSSWTVGGQERLFAIDCCDSADPTSVVLSRAGSLGTLTRSADYDGSKFPDGVRIPEHGLMTALLMHPTITSAIDVGVWDLRDSGQQQWEVRTTIAADGEGRSCDVSRMGIATASTSAGDVFYAFACLASGAKSLNIGVSRSTGDDSDVKTVQLSTASDIDTLLAPAIAPDSDGSAHLLYLPSQSGDLRSLWYARMNTDNSVALERVNIVNLPPSLEVFRGGKKVQVDSLGDGSVRIFFYVKETMSSSGPFQLMHGIYVPRSAEMIAHPIGEPTTNAMISRVVRNQ